MTKEKTLKLKLVPNQLDRAVTFNTFMQKRNIFFSVSHNRINSPLKFQVDTNCELIKSNKIEISTFRNLSKSKFCEIFLNLESKKDEKIDYQNKLMGLNRYYEKHIFHFLKEKYYFHIPEVKKPTNNYMLAIGWKIYCYEEEFNFFFFQRRCYNNITRQNTLRTAGLQFATKNGLKALDEYYDHSLNSIKKIDKVPFLIDKENSTADIDDIFVEEE